MTWREQLRKATFRGVPFFVDGVETEGGRRIVTHKYPNRDSAYSEDLGLDADEFSVRAYLVGDDYIDARDALIRELKRPGVGTLVLPSQGSLKVVFKRFRQSYDSQQGGIEYLDLTFVESGDNRYPAQSVDTRSSVSNAADKAIRTMATIFQVGFQTNALPEFVATSANQNAQKLADDLTLAAGLKSRDAEKAAVFSDALSEFGSNISSLVRDGVSYTEQVQNLLGQLQELYPQPADSYQAYQSLLTYGNMFVPVPETTSTRRQQALNQKLQVALVKRLALAGMAKSAADVEFESYNDAVMLRDELADAIDDELLEIGRTDDDQAYLDFNGLRAEMSRDVTTRAANLERIRNVTNLRALPSLVMSYDLYETADRADEIVARNKIRHPGFLPAGQPLQILV